MPTFSKVTPDDTPRPNDEGGNLLNDYLLSLFAQLPNVLHRPTPGPGGLGCVTICAGGAGGWLRLDQIFHHEARSPEEPDPVSVGQLKIHLVFPLQIAHPKVVVDQAVGEPVRLDVLTQELDRRAGREGEESSRSQQTRRLWNSSLRIAESHRSPVTENDVKAGIRQWHIFGTGFNQGEVYTCFLHEATGVLELS